MRNTVAYKKSGNLVFYQGLECDLHIKSAMSLRHITRNHFIRIGSTKTAILSPKIFVADEKLDRFVKLWVICDPSLHMNFLYAFCDICRGLLQIDWFSLNNYACKL